LGKHTHTPDAASFFAHVEAANLLFFVPGRKTPLLLFPKLKGSSSPRSTWREFYSRSALLSWIDIPGTAHFVHAKEGKARAASTLAAWRTTWRRSRANSDNWHQVVLRLKVASANLLLSSKAIDTRESDLIASLSGPSTGRARRPPSPSSSPAWPAVRPANPGACWRQI